MSNYANHPDVVLFESQAAPPVLACCEHIAGTERFLQKAFELQHQLDGCFDVTCDLEDGAPASNILDHAKALLPVFTSPLNRYDRAGVRLPHHEILGWQEIVELFVRDAGSRIAYFTLPKIRSYRELLPVVSALQAIEDTFEIAHPIPLHVLVETSGAVQDVHSIASLARVECLDFGLMDFVSQYLGVIPEEAMRSPGQFENEVLRQVKTEIVRAATDNNCVASHNVTTAYADAETTFSDAFIARHQFGFTRMWSIHPAQIEPICRAMKPDPAALEASQKIVQQGAAADWAPVSFNGILHDRASFRFHWQRCKHARKSGVALNPEFVARFF